MSFSKKYDNGLRLVANKIDGLLSVTAGVIVLTGSANEFNEDNGISHFIEHTVFKGTQKRSSFEISDYIDRIGAQINAFTSKETTCFYTKSTSEHLKDSLEVLSDIFFNAVFDKKEIDKEKGVVIEEINMCEDSPEDLCLDMLSEAYYGNQTFGRTILGPSKNIRKFTKADIEKYMDKYYTADNVVISIAGNIDEKEVEKLVDEFFATKFKREKAVNQVYTGEKKYGNLFKTKKIEQSHIGISFDGVSVSDKNLDAVNMANIILGGGMSSRLFQKIREELGLCYSVYSYPSQYKDNGVIEIYAGVSTDKRDLAYKSILDELYLFREKGITEQELLRSKEQMKSSLVLGQESTASQMILFGKYMLFLDKTFDFKKKIKDIESISLDEINAVIKQTFNFDKKATATLGPSRKALPL